MKPPRPSKLDNPTPHLRRSGKRRLHRELRRRAKLETRRVNHEEQD